MAKSTETKDKELEQDILNEGVKAVPSSNAAEADLNETLKANAEKAAAESGGQQKEGKENSEELDQSANQSLQIPSPQVNQAFVVPEYIQKNPPINQEEMDAISGFLEGYRKQPTQEEKAKEQEADETAQLVKAYGKNYVKARKGQSEQYFTAITWQRMGGNKNQDGWREVVQTPPEVKDLKGGL